MPKLDILIADMRAQLIFKIFTWGTRLLLFIAFLPSGLKKVMGERFTLIPIENPIGFFFEALYRTGFYWNFLGLMQLIACLLLLIPRTSFFGALLYLPIIINIFIIVSSMHFKGTPIVAGLMLLANIYLLFWDYDKLKRMLSVIFGKNS
ncbi:DoxX family protein [Psychroserpens sp.]|uniref:DoxX family protein n=1 Tax=Psychroserpens sp. TaxID=2020870 RepID=UPI001B12C33B|nr:DoxX family protein [Psychroserpens sp.]MBO6607584.1 DoxX family protein [Psychroserpens sp.]MBO6630902.1 DoxX family protein [Psychroserpens sp.]MBO6655104.1 DoxX family protein [Psychroserpens sp.]MBO6683091.1 DoxX family protein [Psychroserpens sp.]MBO6749730.1 DoxX family protein [Psychroserpens sp.]